MPRVSSTSPEIQVLFGRCFSPSPPVSLRVSLSQSLPVSLHVAVSLSAHRCLLFRLAVSLSPCLISVSSVSLCLFYLSVCTRVLQQRAGLQKKCVRQISVPAAEANHSTTHLTSRDITCARVFLGSSAETLRSQVESLRLRPDGSALLVAELVHNIPTLSSRSARRHRFPQLG